MTERQREVLSFIVERWAGGWSLPTYREIGEQFGNSSTNAAFDMLCRLERRGAIRLNERDPDTGRGRSRGYGLVLTHPDVAAMVRRRRAA